MSYKVIPFTARIGNKGSYAEVAKQVEMTIVQESSSEWEFVSCGNVDTIVDGTNGCFGIGAKPGSTTSIMVLVFKK